MKLYKISRSGTAWWDEYEAAIVAAKDENEARTILKGETWIYPEDIVIELVGIAIKGTKSGVILSYL